HLAPFVASSDPHAPFDPRGICQGPDGSIFVGDLGDLGNAYHTGQPGRVIQYKPDGTVAYLAPPPVDPTHGADDYQFGYQTGDATKDTTNGPKGVVIGPDGDLYVSVRTANGV